MSYHHQNTPRQRETEGKLFPFRVNDFATFGQKAFPFFKQPREIGTYSLDGERKLYNNNSQNLKLYCPPEPETHLDLSKGYNTVIRKDSSRNEKLDTLLEFLLRNKATAFTSPGSNNSSQSSLKPTADIVCFRGLLTTLVCTPYENQDGWIICATKFRGTIYLCAFDTEYATSRRNSMSEREKMMSYWGYKFEQYVTSDSPIAKPDADKPLNENEEHCVVFKTRLNDTTIVYGAEVDCVDKCSQDSNSANKYIELKTSRIITSERQDRNFRRFKLIKWWAQSFLIGIPKIICGFRNDEGQVVQIKTFETNTIPKLAKGLWDPCSSFNFLDQFLNYIKRCVANDDALTVYKFEWSPGNDIVCVEHKAPTIYQILPEWYYSQLKDDNVIRM